MPSNLLNEALDGFRNSKDSDIETFLRYKAILFEERHWCSTYLLFNKEKYIKQEFRIEGYFTLSNKALFISDEVSGNVKKKLNNGLLT